MKEDFEKRHFSHCFTKKGESRLLSKMAVPVPRTKKNDLYYCPNIALQTTFAHWKMVSGFLPSVAKTVRRGAFSQNPPSEVGGWKKIQGDFMEQQPRLPR